MAFFRRVLAGLMLAAFVAIALMPTMDVLSQKAKKDGADALLKPQPRPKRPDLPPSKLPLASSAT